MVLCVSCVCMWKVCQMGLQECHILCTLMGFLCSFHCVISWAKKKIWIIDMNCFWNKWHAPPKSLLLLTSKFYSLVCKCCCICCKVVLVLRSTGHFHLLVDRWLQYFLNVMEPSAHSTGCAYMDMHLCIHCVFSDSTGQSVCVHVLCAHVPTICFIYVQCSRSFFFFFLSLALITWATL